MIATRPLDCSPPSSMCTRMVRAWGLRTTSAVVRATTVYLLSLASSLDTSEFSALRRIAIGMRHSCPAEVRILTRHHASCFIGRSSLPLACVENLHLSTLVHAVMLRPHSARSGGMLDSTTIDVDRDGMHIGIFVLIRLASG